MGKRVGHCKHYTREVYEKGACAAGVNVRERVGGDDLGWLGRIPCHPSIRAGAHPAFTCEHFAEPTAEELAQEKAASDASFKRIMKARAAILAAGAKPRTQGDLSCPVCEAGTLRWSMASNGHVHANCSTAGCVSWME
jgi:hypothetical protein